MSFNPFNPVGRYNIRTYLYENKRVVLLCIVGMVFILASLGFVVWQNDGKDLSSPPRPAPPPPRYGSGPYGYGLYAPPKELFENPPD
jgi:hypothetical protein